MGKLRYFSLAYYCPTLIAKEEPGSRSEERVERRERDQVSDSCTLHAQREDNWNVPLALEFFLVKLKVKRRLSKTILRIHHQAETDSPQDFRVKPPTDKRTSSLTKWDVFWRWVWRHLVKIHHWQLSEKLLTQWNSRHFPIITWPISPQGPNLALLGLSAKRSGPLESSRNQTQTCLHDP